MAEFDANKTIRYTFDGMERSELREILGDVYDALCVKGYNPVNQIVGYILSEDPTYITNYNNARTKISKIDRERLLKELVASFLDLK